MAALILSGLYPDRRDDRGMRQFGTGQYHFPELLHQCIGQPREQDAQPVGEEVLTTGTPLEPAK
ncbi:MAG: hypothetical protein AB1513_05400 [Pseudomonadota bacterium]